MCIIYWKSLMTGFIGHSEPISLEIAKAWLRVTSIPDIIHWIELI